MAGRLERRRCRRCNGFRAGRGRCLKCARIEGNRPPEGMRRCADCSVHVPVDGPTRCAACAAKRSPEYKEYRRQLSAARFPEHVRDDLLFDLAAGGKFSEVCASLDVTTQQVFGWRAFDDSWGAKLDEALMAGRDPDLPHGSMRGHKLGCRCPECRAAKQETPSVWRRKGI